MQDDYVKFIRFAQYKIEQTGEGIVAIVTNHAFLENPTFRGMRYSLMQSFDQIHIIDLHGNSKKTEKTPENEKDENVFDIQQGVCISILIKQKGLKKVVKRADFWGKRDIKNKQLYEAEWNNIEWNTLQPTKPFFLFTKQNTEYRELYNSWLSVKDMFIKKSLGIVTGRDKLTIKDSFIEIKNLINEFVKLSPSEAREKFKTGKDVRDWQVSLAQKDLKTSGVLSKNIRQISYRLFDKKFTYFTGRSRGFQSMPRGEVMRNMIFENISLNVPRQVFRGNFKHVFISKNLTGANLLQSANGQTHFPLYIYQTIIDEKTKKHKEIKLVNFTYNFKKLITEKYENKFIPEQILSYIYGILHSPTYRKKYSDFLKIDFPRIPFLDNTEDFEKIAKLGAELIKAHLMEEIPEYDIAETYDGVVGNDTVEKVKFEEVKNVGRIYINKTNYFEDIPEKIFNFYIGGYKVIDKYLKSRKGKELQIEDIEQVKDIAKILAFTIEKMEELENVTNEII